MLHSVSDEHSPAFSPDGRWLASISDESGTPEVYVQSFMPDGTLGTDRRRVSTNGGAVPNWRRGGEELFYVAGDGQMMSVPVRKRGSNLEFDVPHALFKTRMLGAGYSSAFHEFDVTPDGQRFLVGTLVGEPTSPLPTVVVNWMAGLRKWRRSGTTRTKNLNQEPSTLNPEPTN